MTEILYYPVVDMNTDGSEKQSMLPTKNAKSVREHHRFWLEEAVPHYFRLCASEEHPVEEVAGFKVHCPYCGDALNPISALTREKRYFLYACNHCTKRKEE